MKLPRGKTFKPKGNPAKRPPKLKGRVANDLWAPPARSAMGPPPACDTQEPRGKGLTRGRRR
jgi:hypothetical protein